jgi:hypothetical protein
LVAGSPSIDWDIGITIDTSGPEPIYEVNGTWDGYPAVELYINRQPAFTFMPGQESASSRDLIKLLPGYGDVHFVRRGSLTGQSTGDVRRRVTDPRLPLRARIEPIGPLQLPHP